MWHDHSSSQTIKTIERAVGVGVGDSRERGWGGARQNLKKRWVGNTGGSS